ncbi:LytR family transcriptional regulator [Alkalibaculum sp. M08DMB]|uniref:LytR family transcriptional regulator n=1 Tax=Alkalibaculum sporogenes TaxID=2655001 RepID=A0A6A7K9X6_9FIRM|nr:LCP family protein [Alkalibaculum sporogenes]MPW26111.1 LytR family transcriptional regulator [Alkalibaculum sporogenes]
MAKNKKKQKKKGNRTKKVAITLVIIIILLTSGFFLVYNKFLGGINTVELGDDLSISSELNKNKNITNIALFGIDTRGDDYDGSRADTIMIATVDKQHKKLKLTSIMRDTYVSIPGKKFDKINHAYAFGGPELTIKTINQNFDMNIMEYVTVNFTALEKIVDSVGGVQIDVKSAEINSLNHNLSELDIIEGKSSKQVTSAGLQTLTGRQAVAYSRIRNVGNNDYARTERQRTVLQNLVTGVLKGRSLTQVLSLIETLSPYIETSLSSGEMIGLATTVFTLGISEMEDTRLPLDDYSKGGTWGGVYYLKPNTLVDNVAYLHEFIFEEEDYVPTSVVSGISNEMN